jgi:hypothetical protein
MSSHVLKIPALFLLCSLCACQSVRQHPNASPAPAETVTGEKSAADLQTRNNALALLDDLLNDEKNLSKILIIKRNSDELGRLVENISKTSGRDADFLETMAKSEPGLDLKKKDLPPGETATRKAISKTQEHVLLHSKDEEFEFQLLLTQVEALNYGAHLAMVAAENEPQASRTREFLEMGARFRELREQVLAMLRAKK